MIQHQILPSQTCPIEKQQRMLKYLKNKIAVNIYIFEKDNLYPLMFERLTSLFHKKVCVQEFAHINITDSARCVAFILACQQHLFVW